MERPSFGGNLPERKSILPKPLTPVGHGVGSSALGARMPAHMTPEDKTKFLLKLEEFRKQKLQAKQDTSGKSKIPSIIPVIVKAKAPLTSMVKQGDDTMKKETSRNGTSEGPNEKIDAVHREVVKETQDNERKEAQTGEIQTLEDKMGEPQPDPDRQKETLIDKIKEPQKDGVTEMRAKVEIKKPVKDVKKQTPKEEKKGEKKTLAKSQKQDATKTEKKEAVKDDLKDGKKEENVFERFQKQVKKQGKKDEKKNEKNPFTFRDRFETWLADRGHSLSGKRHLSCFEVDPSINIPVFPTLKNRLFRKSTRVSMAKKVEKVEPKMEPPKHTRMSFKPKKTSSTSSLKQVNVVKASEPEPTPKPKDNQKRKEPKPVDKPKEEEPEPEPIDNSKREKEPSPMVMEEIPSEKLPVEEIPEPEMIVEIATEPSEPVSEMELDVSEEPKNDTLEIVEQPPAIVVSKPEEVEKEILNDKIPKSEEKIPNKKPVVKFSSGERPAKKIPNQKKLDINNKKSLSDKPAKQQKNLTEKEKKIKMRRSISMIHRKKTGNAESAIHRTVSEHDLSFTEPEEDIIRKPALKEEQTEEMRPRSKSVTFQTPKAKTPNPFILRDKLESWLADRGHSISGYRHLNCFGINSNTVNTPVFQTPKNKFNETLEQSQYATAPNTPIEDSDKENMTPTPTPATAIQRIDIQEVEGWLTDLHKLIVDLKYPHNRCEEWLTAIRRKCIGCTQLPAYWECLAALEESRGEMNAAIEYYERAIIKGAEVEAVGDSLEHLFDKLIIDSDKTPSKPDRNVDPKNIFKSTIIKFALQQKAVKELGPEIGTKAKQQLYVATPVRRSSRIQTPYKPHVVSSLKSLDPELKDNVEFQTNKFLLTEK